MAFRPETGMNIMSKPILEPAAQEIADATSNPPFLYELGPEGAGKVLNAAIEQAVRTLRTAFGN
ncbi:hypothetical protein GCM10010377_78620 [Streptomyces viridiviolaceus]|nr:hypothetical protein GCM10010377_78620 [Streptomyces viridiviolaceus]